VNVLSRSPRDFRDPNFESGLHSETPSKDPRLVVPTRIQTFANTSLTCHRAVTLTVQS
jgi:hypothetical protein